MKVAGTKGTTNISGQEHHVGLDKGVFKSSYIGTKGQSPYEGWGTALKPANEPICVARKPLSEKSVAENVLKGGNGGINVFGLVSTVFYAALDKTMIGLRMKK
jgi:hypothetical protein